MSWEDVQRLLFVTFVLIGFLMVAVFWLGYCALPPV